MFFQMIELLKQFFGLPEVRVLTGLFSFVSLLISIWFARKTLGALQKSEATTQYLALDQIYAELLKLAIRYPHLRNPGSQKSGEELAQYNSYAQLVYNFLETIYDKFSGNKRMLQTWGTALIFEGNLHNEWLKRDENSVQYNKDFRDFLEKFRNLKEPPR